MASSPLGRHQLSPTELKAQIEAERRGLPFLAYRDAAGQQRLLELDAEASPVSVGRGPDTDVVLDWDTEASRLHALIERIGGYWTLVDDGLSSNGSYVNGKRVSGRQRLRDADILRFGNTDVLFRAPPRGESITTLPPQDLRLAPDLSAAQRRVLVALCRPLKDPHGLATPATNQQIAEELFLSLDAVKGHLRALFQKFGLEELPQNQKRLQLVERAFATGAVSRSEL